jgi:hypothetical protein
MHRIHVLAAPKLRYNSMILSDLTEGRYQPGFPVAFNFDLRAEAIGVLTHNPKVLIGFENFLLFFEPGILEQL